MSAKKDPLSPYIVWPVGAVNVSTSHECLDFEKLRLLVGLVGCDSVVFL